MSSQTIKLSVSEREITGKKVGVLRREGRIPGVINERGHDSLNVVADINPLTKAWHTAGGNHVLDLDLAGKSKTVMFKHVTLDPVRGTISHFVLQAIKQNEAVEAEIPVVVVGEVPAERKGLFLVHPLDTITVKALPANLPDKFELDGSSLENAGDNLKVEDIKTNDKVEILTEPDRPIVVVEEPRAAVEAEAEAETTEEASEVPSDHGGEEKPDES